MSDAGKKPVTRGKIITNVSDLVCAVNHALATMKRPVWWRGQGCAEWPLQPSAFRAGRSFVAREVQRSAAFRLTAPGMYAHCPAAHDYPSWLFIMQHYGLDTRMLDWTELPMVAAWFAAEHDKKEDEAKDAVLWALAPQKLNLQSVGKERTALPDSRECAQLFRTAIKGGCEVTKCVAVEPVVVDVRIAVQGSMFTIHGDPTPLEEYAKPGVLVKHIIPAAKKRELEKQLTDFGVYTSVLFPDLDHLSCDVNGRYGKDWVEPAP